jgi:hypothetical protein
MLLVPNSLPITLRSLLPLSTCPCRSFAARSSPPFQLVPPRPPLQHPSAGGGPIDNNNDNTFHTPLGNALDLLYGDFEMHDGNNVDGEEFNSSPAHHAISLDSP